MRYYIVDNQGITHGESGDKDKAELLLGDLKDDLKNKGMTPEEIQGLELEVIEGQ